jgi:hypothetical protein
MIHQQIPSISPSASARILFGRMVKKANDLNDHRSYDKDQIYLPLNGTISISIQLKNENKNPDAPEDITELIKLGWITAHDEGGWNLC